MRLDQVEVNVDAIPRKSVLRCGLGSRSWTRLAVDAVVWPLRKEGGERMAAASSNLDRQVARTKTKVGIREWTTKTHGCHKRQLEQGQKEGRGQGISH